MTRILLPAFALFISCHGNHPENTVEEPVESEIRIDAIEPVQHEHIRGLSILNDRIAWASGAGGTFMKTIDGENWTSDTLKGYTHLDFRDVQVLDSSTAVLMASGNEGRILRTTDGGTTWIEVYTRLDTGIFLDGFDFNGSSGICYGDPIRGKLVVIETNDRGQTWQQLNPSTLPETLPNEAGYAASGTGIFLLEDDVYIATGGDSVARLHKKTDSGWSIYNTPMRSGNGCGIFSMAFIPPTTIVAVGGCYMDSIVNKGNCAVSNDLGVTWNTVSENPPNGYRSCVSYSKTTGVLVACGRTGVDVSFDGGGNWKAITDEGYYTCALGDSIGWLFGRDGKAAKLTWN